MEHELRDAVRQPDEDRKEAGEHTGLPAEPRTDHRHQRHIAEPHRLPAQCPRRTGTGEPDHSGGDGEPAERRHQAPPVVATNQPRGHHDRRARDRDEWPGSDQPPPPRPHPRVRHSGLCAHEPPHGERDCRDGQACKRWRRLEPRRPRASQRTDEPEHIGLAQGRRKRAGHLPDHRQKPVGPRGKRRQTGQHTRDGDRVGDDAMPEIDPGGGSQEQEQDSVKAASRGEHRKRGIRSLRHDAATQHLPPPEGQRRRSGHHGSPEHGPRTGSDPRLHEPPHPGCEQATTDETGGHREDRANQRRHTG